MFISEFWRWIMYRTDPGQKENKHIYGNVILFLQMHAIYFLVVSHSYFFQFWCSTTSKDFTAWAEHRLPLLSLWQIIWIHRQVYNASHNKSSLTVICQDTTISCHGYLVPKHWAVMISISLIPKEISLQYVLEWVCIYIVCRESNVCAWVCWTRCVPR